jgi:hypothetical protein
LKQLHEEDEGYGPPICKQISKTLPSHENIEKKEDGTDHCTNSYYSCSSVFLFLFFKLIKDIIKVKLRGVNILLVRYAKGDKWQKSCPTRTTEISS